MDFIAKKTDMNLNLTTLKDEQVTKAPLIPVSGLSAEQIFNFFNDYETENDEREASERDSKIRVIATELAHIYGETPDWWMENFDFATLQEIIIFVGESLAGVKKTLKD